MKKLSVACCICVCLAALSNGCVTRTTTTKGAMTVNGTKTDQDGTCTSKRTVWIWQKAYWSRRGAGADSAYR